MRILTGKEQMKEDKAKNRIALAERIANAGRDRVLMRLRFLHSAFFRLSAEPAEDAGTFMTDAYRIIYDPDHLITEFSKDCFAAQEMWLHSVLHCLFRHMFVHTRVKRRIWDLSCDIAVAALIRDLIPDGLPLISVEALRRLDKEIHPLTAEKIYRYLIDAGMSDGALREMEELFCIDDHSLWYRPAVKSEAGKNSQGEESKGRGKETQIDDRKDVSDDTAEEANSLDDAPTSLWIMDRKGKAAAGRWMDRQTAHLFRHHPMREAKMLNLSGRRYLKGLVLNLRLIPG